MNGETTRKTTCVPVLPPADRLGKSEEGTMRKTITKSLVLTALGGTILAALFAIPATASAGQYLTAGEASRHLGASLHSDYYVKRGSLRANWFRREAPNRLYGTYTVRFQDGSLGWAAPA